MWDIIWVSPQGHRSVSLSHHFLLQAPHCPCSVQKRFSSDHCCRGRSKPGCRIVRSHTRWELTTWADFQLCLHRLLMSAGCKSSHNGFYSKFESILFSVAWSKSHCLLFWKFLDATCNLLCHCCICFFAQWLQVASRNFQNRRQWLLDHATLNKIDS